MKKEQHHQRHHENGKQQVDADGISRFDREERTVLSDVKFDALFLKLFLNVFDFSTDQFADRNGVGIRLFKNLKTERGGTVHTVGLVHIFHAVLNFGHIIQMNIASLTGFTDDKTLHFVDGGKFSRDTNRILSV